MTTNIPRRPPTGLEGSAHAHPARENQPDMPITMAHRGDRNRKDVGNTTNARTVKDSHTNNCGQPTVSATGAIDAQLIANQTKLRTEHEVVGAFARMVDKFVQERATTEDRAVATEICGAVMEHITSSLQAPNVPMTPKPIRATNASTKQQEPPSRAQQSYATVPKNAAVSADGNTTAGAKATPSKSAQKGRKGKRHSQDWWTPECEAARIKHLRTYRAGDGVTQGLRDYKTTLRAAKREYLAKVNDGVKDSKDL